MTRGPSRGIVERNAIAEGFKLAHRAADRPITIAAREVVGAELLVRHPFPENVYAISSI